jgi:hypothetical protein
MSENNNNESESGSNKIELFAAILLGIAAIATAFASFQSSLYGGKSVENYSQANKLATAGLPNAAARSSRWQKTVRLKLTRCA